MLSDWFSAALQTSRKCGRSTSNFWHNPAIQKWRSTVRNWPVCPDQFLVNAFFFHRVREFQAPVSRLSAVIGTCSTHFKTHSSIDFLIMAEWKFLIDFQSSVRERGGHALVQNCLVQDLYEQIGHFVNTLLDYPTIGFHG
jgi:hypothetical protein